VIPRILVIALRAVRDRVVGGSNPLAPTNPLNDLREMTSPIPESIRPFRTWATPFWRVAAASAREVRVVQFRMQFSHAPQCQTILRWYSRLMLSNTTDLPLTVPLLGMSMIEGS
jgi:hypothetical protein